MAPCCRLLLLLLAVTLSSTSAALHHHAQHTLILLSVSAGSTLATTTPPNIVVFVTSAHATGSLQPYMDTTNPLHTPVNAWYGGNINWLASNGLTFDHAYANIARSSPSRISLLTSLNPRKDIQIVNDDGPGTSPLFSPTQRAWPYTAYVTSKNINSFAAGKVFTQQDATTTFAGITYQPPSMGSQDTGFCSAIPGNIYPNICTAPDETYLTDDEGADRAITFLRTAARQPTQQFFLLVGLFRAMGDFSCPAWAYTQLQRIATSMITSLRLDPLMTVAPNLVFAVPLQQQMTATSAAQQKVNYDSTTQWTDFVLGRILDELQGLFLWDKTIIVFTSDVGYSTGEFSFVGTTSVYEHTARVPLIIRHPGYPNSFGARTRARVELVDLFPTLMKLGKIDLPKTGPGTAYAQQVGVSFAGVVALASNQNSANTISSRYGAITEVARCTATTLPFNGLTPGTVYRGAWTDDCSTARGADVMGISFRDDRYRYTEWRWAKRISTGEIAVDWTLQGLFGRELYDHGQDDGLYGAAQNLFERGQQNLAPCPSCNIIVPQGNPSNGPNTPPTPDLPSDPLISNLIRSYARMLRAQVRDSAPLCNGHGFFSDNTQSCEFCDSGWDGSQCQTALYPQLTGASVPTTKPTMLPTPNKPPVGAPTLPGDATQSPTYPFVGTPFPTTANPTTAPVPVPCGSRGAKTRTACESRGDCVWFYRFQACVARTNSPTMTPSQHPTAAYTAPPTPPTQSPTQFPTKNGVGTSSPIGSAGSPPTNLPTPQPSLFPGNPQTCGALNQRGCSIINGCQWQGSIDGCQAPMPLPCGCPAALNPYLATNGQYYRNSCHAQCKGLGSASTSDNPSAAPTSSPQNFGPTTAPFPLVPGQGPAQMVKSLDLLFVVDASAMSASFAPDCIKAKGVSCWVLLANFLDNVQKTLVGFVQGGYAGPAGDQNPQGLRVGLITYSCVPPYPTKTEVFLTTGDQSTIEAGFQQMKSSMQPAGGRCPVAALQDMLDHDAFTNTIIRPNRALVMFMQGNINDLTSPAAVMTEFRMRGVPTFEVLSSRRLVQAAGPGLTATDAATLLFQALQLAGDASRIWNTGAYGWVALDAFVDRVSAGVLTMINQPSRLSVQVGVAPAEWGPDPGTTTPPDTQVSDNSTPPTSQSLSGIIGGVICTALIALVAAVVGVAKRRAIQNDTSVMAETKKMMGGGGRLNSGGRGAVTSDDGDFKLVIQNVGRGTPHPYLSSGGRHNNNTTLAVGLGKQKNSETEDRPPELQTTGLGLHVDLTAPASPVKHARRRSVDSMSSAGSSPPPQSTLPSGPVGGQMQIHLGEML